LLYSSAVIYFLNLLLVAAPFFLGSLLVRLYVVLVAPQYFHYALLWGLVADLLWSLLPAALVVLLPRLRATLMAALLLCWMLTHWLDAQSLLALGVGADYRDFHYALDPVFLKSTLANLSGWSLLVAAIVVAIVVALVGWACRQLLLRLRFVATPLAVPAAGICVVLLVLGFLPQAAVSDWRRHNSVGTQLQNWRLNSSAPQSGALPFSRQLLLAGEPAAANTALPGAAKNVLLIVLEGLPGAYLPQVSSPAMQLSQSHAAPWKSWTGTSCRVS
jgi:hypothetical protein